MIRRTTILAALLATFLLGLCGCSASQIAAFAAAIPENPGIRLQLPAVPDDETRGTPIRARPYVDSEKAIFVRDAKRSLAPPRREVLDPCGEPVK